ncbi:type II CAAX endopeptidase family protein [Bifidobacterium sp. ESL0704]|uniref:CPBP family intramembrane glutamic endopeptidase n=1 Tax=Bifidobacterium sp. ESL0704 TaxID=2983219 RepID=UPI0023F8DCE0|nr:type II CAAX endopeptidase family protein [Bifidobacterium sp. ESL0704]WEV52659.1 type II CAAX endopeptidase family protein [Bifidobacterium sp. ESL0704]
MHKYYGLRNDDLLTDDHPERLHAANNAFVEPRRLNPLLRGIVFLAIFFVAMVVIAMVLMGTYAAATGASVGALSQQDVHSPMTLLEMLSEMIAAIVGYVVVVRFMERRRHPLELRASRWHGLFVGFAIGLAAIAVCLAVLFITGNYRVIGFNAHYNPWIDILAMGVCAGVAEEIIMRGMLLRLFEEWLGSWGAVVVSALVFGLMHVANQDGTMWGGVAIAIEDGILAAALYFVTRSLWVCIGEHIMWNIAEGPIFGSIVSGNGKQDSWLIPQWSGSDIMTGGKFGLEASVVPVVLMGVAGVALLIYAQRKELLARPSWVRKRKLSQER